MGRGGEGPQERRNEREDGERRDMERKIETEA